MTAAFTGVLLALAGCAQPDIERDSPSATAVPTAPIASRDALQAADDDASASTPVRASASIFRQTGVATWYGQRFHGRRTASGEPYDMHALTAAHRTLPLGACVRVTALGSARSVIVRINDRGPFVSNRVIDLSYAAAQILGFASSGNAQVTLERVAAAHRCLEQAAGWSDPGAS